MIVRPLVIVLQWPCISITLINFPFQDLINYSSMVVLYLLLFPLINPAKCILITQTIGWLLSWITGFKVTNRSITTAVVFITAKNNNIFACCIIATEQRHPIYGVIPWENCPSRVSDCFKKKKVFCTHGHSKGAYINYRRMCLPHDKRSLKGVCNWAKKREKNERDSA